MPTRAPLSNALFRMRQKAFLRAQNARNVAPWCENGVETVAKWRFCGARIWTIFRYTVTWDEQKIAILKPNFEKKNSVDAYASSSFECAIQNASKSVFKGSKWPKRSLPGAKMASKRWQNRDFAGLESEPFFRYTVTWDEQKIATLEPNFEKKKFCRCLRELLFRMSYSECVKKRF